MGSHPANLALRFILELGALVGLGVWGWSLTDGWARGALMIALPLAAAIVWGTFAVPDDPSRSGRAPVVTAGWLRLIIELAVFGLGVIGFAQGGLPVAAFVLLVAVVLHYALSVDRLRWLLAQ